ncbi:MAG: ABC transporter permease [Acidobacteriota bacterium]
MASLFQDVRYAWRQLYKKPGFAAAAIVTLALGIGASTAMFTVVDGVLLKPLQYPEPERLLALHVQTGKYGDKWGFSFPDFLDCRRDSRTLGPVAAWTYSGATVSAPGEPEYVEGRQVSSDLFSVLGVSLLRGRAFSSTEDTPGAAPVAIISARLWRSRFGGDRSAFDKTLTYDGKAYTVIGVAPPGFHLDGDVDVLTPLGQATEPRMRNRGAHFLHVVARLRPSANFASAQSELSLIGHQLAKQYPDSNQGINIAPHPLQEEMVRNVGSTLWLLLGAVTMVLLIACANVASLLLARAVSRERELAIRTALGANRGRLIRQCLAESVVLGICGGGLGLLIANFGNRPFVKFWPDSLPRASEVHVDWRVLLFALGVSLASSFLFGLVPALRTPRATLEQTLRSGARTIAGKSKRLHSTFVISEIAIAVVLLICAGLLGRTLLRLAARDPGLDVHNLITARVAFSPGVLSNPAQTRAAWREFAENLGHVPGVRDVALTDIVPMRVGENVVGYWATPVAPAPNQSPIALASAVSRDYLRTMRIPLLRGRFFNDGDRLDHASVVVIDENLARHAFVNEDPVGKQLWIPAMGKAPIEVIGVVGHVRHWGLADDDQSQVQDQFYYPLAEVPDTLTRFFSSVMSVAVRTDVSPLSMVGALQGQARGSSGDQALYEIRTMDQLVRASLDLQRFLLWLFGIFSALALLLACLGIYGVIAYLTNERVREFGVRMALGASTENVMQLVVRQGLILAIAGAGIGAVMSVAAGRVLRRMVAGVGGPDPVVFLAMLSVLFAVALVACYLPARRAAKVDPMVALRYE